MSENITRRESRPTRGRVTGHVAFLFGLAGQEWLSGAALRHLLADLDVSETAARALLSRMQQHGQLESVREGRRARYRLAGDFAAGFRRIRRRGEQDGSAWSGTFHTLLFHVPESERAYRDQLRRAALLSGYAVLQPGVLICPTDRRAALADVLTAAPSDARIVPGTLALSDTDAAAAASLAWDLPDLARTYRGHVDRLRAATEAQTEAQTGARAGDDPGAGPVALRLAVRLVQPAYSATLLEPAVPAALMPPDWPGPAMREAAAHLLRVLSPAIDAHLARVLAAGG